jgi:hypothetical protein
MDTPRQYQPLTVDDELDDLFNQHLQVEAERLTAVMGRDPLPAGDTDSTVEAVWLQLQAGVLLARIRLEQPDRKRFEEEREAALEGERPEFFDRREDGGGRGPRSGFVAWSVGLRTPHQTLLAASDGTA